jgi:hypothetical protein
MINLQSQRDASFTTAVGTTIRPPTTALLTIDSEDRFTSLTNKRASTIASRNSSAYNFTITKNESLMNGFFTRLAVSEIVFPWTIPNINGKTNTMIIDFKIDADPIETTFCSFITGFYTPIQLAQKLVTFVRGLDPAFSGFTMSYGDFGLPRFNYNTGSATIGIAFRPLLANNLPNPITYPADSILLFPYSDNTKQLFDVLGFSNLNSVLAYGGATFASDTYGNATLCQPIRYVDIVCTQLTYNQALKDTSSQVVSRDALCRLYLGNGSGSPLANTALYSLGSTLEPPVFNQFYCPVGCAPFVIYQQYNNPKQIQWQPNQPVPGYLVFQVYDDVGDLLDSSAVYSANTSGQNEDWSMTLLVSEN